MQELYRSGAHFGLGSCTMRALRFCWLASQSEVQQYNTIKILLGAFRRQC